MFFLRLLYSICWPSLVFLRNNIVSVVNKNVAVMPNIIENVCLFSVIAVHPCIQPNSPMVGGVMSSIAYDIVS